MRRIAVTALLGILFMAPVAGAQPIDSLENLRTKTPITEQDRQQIQEWLRPLVRDLIATRDPELSRMIEARRAIVREGRPDNPAWTQGYIDAFGEIAIEMLSGASEQAVSQEARVNLVMTVAELRRVEGVSLLTTILTEDPYAATRYLAAKGLNLVAPTITDRVMPQLESDIATACSKVVREELNGATLTHIFETLGQFTHEKAHDVLAFAVAQAAVKGDASEPSMARAYDAGIEALQNAHRTEARPEGRQRIMRALAILCAYIMPPVADPNLMDGLNAVLEQLTNNDVGYIRGWRQERKKLALMEWVEVLVANRFIEQRPRLPKRIEDAVGAATAG